MVNPFWMNGIHAGTRTQFLASRCMTTSLGSKRLLTAARAQWSGIRYMHTDGEPQVPAGDGSDGASQGGWLRSLLGTSEFTSGGLTIMAAGVGVSVFYKMLSAVDQFARRVFLTRAHFDSRDDTYRWLLHWLARSKQYRITNFTVTTSLGRYGESTVASSLPASPTELLDKLKGQGKEGDAIPAVYFVPRGEFFIRYKNKWMYISRDTMVSDRPMGNSNMHLESIEVTAFGQCMDVVQSLIVEAAESYLTSQKEHTAVYFSDQYGNWNKTTSRPIRQLESVVLEESLGDKLLADCREFLSSEGWYRTHGIPYRRGYLLYGPPGTGKSSIVAALAGQLGLNVYVLNLSAPITDDVLTGLMNSAAPKCVILIEDVDSAMSEAGAANTLSFSGLLNALDGLQSQEGRLLFMTTNHRQRIDKALIRPGRIDMQLEIGLATSHQISEYIHRFYEFPEDEASKESIRRLVAAVPSKTASIAQIQAHLLRYKKDVHGAANHVDDLLQVVSAGRAGPTHAHGLPRHKSDR